MARAAWDALEPWDVVVIGSGATGGWAAHELGRHGLRVLVLEAGADQRDLPEHQPDDVLDAKRTFDRLYRRRATQSRSAAYWELDPDLFVRDDEHPYETVEGHEFPWIRTRSVNGRLLTWNGVGVRVSDYELRAPEQDGFGPRWPLAYADLAPHYDRLDAFLPVYGEVDRLPQLPDGKYVGTCRLTEAEMAFQRAVRRTGAGRTAIATRGVLVRPASRVRAEELAPPSPVRAAIQKFGVTMRTDSVVSHILTGTDGMPSGVAFVDRVSKTSYEVRARAVALCASTLESARILLNSRCRHHPAGLGNSSGTLGHYLMDHPAVHVFGFVAGNRDEVWSDGVGGPKSVMVPRFHNLENRAGGAFLRGFGMMGHAGRMRWNKTRSAPNEVPISFVAYGEMLPRYENEVSLHPDKRDAWGIPIARIACSFSDNERAMQQYMSDALLEIIEDEMGGRVEGEPSYHKPGGFSHEMGTARMGDSPQSSVLNSYAQCWDAPNVFVMDGAAWPTGAWQNPTFTMMAIAARASERLASELKQGRF